jgi:hypothetical protein
MSDHRSEVHGPTPSTIARRWFFKQCGVGLAPIAATALLNDRALGATDTRSSDTTQDASITPKPLMQGPHFPGKAKRVIYLFQAGAPSHLELFDPKPELQRLDGTLPPAELLAGYRAAFIKPNSALLGGKFSFAKHGQSGIELSEVLPHTARIVDDLCLIRTMQTNAVNHAPAQILMNTGSEQFGRPSFGAWTVYGLGSESADFPGFVVLTSAKGTSGGASNYGSGFLPTPYGGVPFRSAGDPILYLSNPPGIDQQAQGDSIAALNRLNQLSANAYNDPQIEARIKSYEMAYRLQMSAPQLMDLSSESVETLAAYGVKDGKEASFAKNCLLARRLIERGVRFVQLFHEAWDQHGDLTNGVRNNARDTDQASAALVLDLKQRGLLEDTLVIWGGEFGRTPMAQGGTDGRDHHNRCFSLWLAGGGIKPGYVHGQTDELGFNSVSKPVHIHDLNATLLHLLGFDHTRLTFRFQGRDYRLTDVHGEVVHELLA